MDDFEEKLIINECKKSYKQIANITLIQMKPTWQTTSINSAIFQVVNKNEMFRCSIPTECCEMAYRIYLFTTSERNNTFSHRGCKISHNKRDYTELGTNIRRQSSK